MVFITHDLAEALRLGDRIALMRDGRIVQLGTPEEIVGSPADDYVRDFVRDVPREQVLTVRSAMRPAAAGEAERGPALAPATTVVEAIQAVARSGGPARVVDHGRCLGVVDDAGLLAVVAGLPAGTGRGWRHDPPGPSRGPRPRREEVVRVTATPTPTHTPTHTRAAAPSQAPQSVERSAGPGSADTASAPRTAPADPWPPSPRAAGSSSRWASPSPC